MAGTVENIARSIDNVTAQVWDRQSTPIRILVLVVLLLSGVGIPLIIIAVIARAIVQ